MTLPTLCANRLLVRYGGEEFVIVLLDTSAEMALYVAEKIRAKVDSLM